MKALLLLFLPALLSAQQEDLQYSGDYTTITTGSGITIVSIGITFADADGSSFHCMGREDISNKCHVPPYYVGMEWFISQECIIWEKLSCCPGMFCYKELGKYYSGLTDGQTFKTHRTNAGSLVFDLVDIYTFAHAEQAIKEMERRER